jgi:hypothetical protein
VVLLGQESAIPRAIGWPASPSADSDEVARAFRDDVARRSDMMSPGSDASLAGDLWNVAIEKIVSKTHVSARDLVARIKAVLRDSHRATPSATWSFSRPAKSTGTARRPRQP